MWISKQTDVQFWCKTQLLNGFNHIRVQRNSQKKPKRAWKEFLDPTTKPTVICTDNSLEFGMACEDLSWNLCTATPHCQETNGFAERALRWIREGTSAVLLQCGLDENWRADSMECFCYLRHFSWPNVWREKHRVKGDLNHMKDRSFRLLHWLIITLFPQMTSQEFIILERKYSLKIPRLWIVRAGDLERRHTGCGPWGAGRDGRIGNPC